MRRHSPRLYRLSKHSLPPETVTSPRQYDESWASHEVQDAQIAATLTGPLPEQCRYKPDGFLLFLGGCQRNYTCLSHQSCVGLKASGWDGNYISCNVQHLVHSCCAEWNTKLTAVWSSSSSPQSRIAEFLNMPLKLHSGEKSVKLDLCLCLPFPCAPFLLLHI